MCKCPLCPAIFENLAKTAPELVVSKNYPAASSIGMRTGKTELPFSKKEVRKALMMAIDYESIIEELY